MSKEQKSSWFLKWVTDPWKRLRSPLTVLKIPDQPQPSVKLSHDGRADPAKAHPAVVSGLDPSITGCYIKFKVPGTDRTFIGTPLKFLPGRYQQHVIEPGSRNALGALGIWANDTDATGNIDWLDDPEQGLFCRKIYQPKEVLGCKGTIQGVPYAFDDILQVGQNLLVYQLTNLNTCSYVACGLGRDEFDARYAFIKHLRRVGQGRCEYSPPKVIALADRVLEAFPLDDTALFNKGVALMIERNFVQSHTCFEILIRQKPDDQLAILHDAAVLASMGEHDFAVEQFARADAISEGEVRSNLNSGQAVRDTLRDLIVKLMQSSPTQGIVQDLWLKYFCSDIETTT